MFDKLAKANKEKQKTSVRKLLANNIQVDKQNDALKNLLQRRNRRDNDLSKKRAFNHLRDNMKEGRDKDEHKRKCEELAKMLRNGLLRKLKYTLLLLISK